MVFNSVRSWGVDNSELKCRERFPTFVIHNDKHRCGSQTLGNVREIIPIFLAFISYVYVSTDTGNTPTTPTCNYDTKGRDFMILFMENHATTQDMQLLVSTDVANAVSGSVTSYRWTNPYVNTAVSVTNGAPQTITIPVALMETNAGFSDKALRLMTNDDVSVLAFNYQGPYCGATLAMPYDALGTVYYAVTWTPSQDYRAQIGVTAALDNTVVDIRFMTYGINVEYDGRTYVQGDTLRVSYLPQIHLITIF